MITISNTEMTTWDRCPRKWLTLYYFGYAPADEPITSNRLLGIRVHTALEGFYGYDLDPLQVLDVLYSLVLAENPEAETEIKAEHDMANAMVSGYLEWLTETGADADLKIIATEADLQIPMPGRENEVMLRSRMDQVLQRLSDGALLFLDHKTAASFDRHELLELDVQMPHYCMMQQMAASRAGQNAPPVVGGIVNTLRRVKRTSRSQPPYYQRDPIYCNPDRIATAWHRTTKIVSEILDARAKLDWFFTLEPDARDPWAMNLMNQIQREHMRAVPMINDCSWSCPLAGGLCAGMSDGSDWLGMLQRSGHWKKVDPYEYYRDDPIQAIRAAISGTMEPDQGDDAR